MIFRLYDYPEYTSLSEPGTEAFVKECASLLTGSWDKQKMYITPAIFPRFIDLKEREVLCNQKSNTSTTFDPITNPAPFALTYYQKGATLIFHPKTKCRRMLLVSSMGSGKSLIVGQIIAEFANLTNYDAFDKQNKNKQSLTTKKDYTEAHAKLTAPHASHASRASSYVPKKIVFATIRRNIIDQMCEDFTRCPAFYHPFFQQFFKSIEKVAKPGSPDSYRLRFGTEWAKTIGVELWSITQLGNIVSNPAYRSSLEGALLIIDEVHSVFTPQDVTTERWWKALPQVLDITSHVNLYGLLGLTATPVINSFTNVIDLHRLFVSGDTHLDPGPDLCLKSTEFLNQYVVTKPLDIKTPISVEGKDGFLSRCGWGGPAYESYKKANFLKPEAQEYFKRMFSLMQNYVYTYDSSNDKLRMATKTVRVVMDNHLITTSSTTEVDTFIPQDKARQYFVNWAVRSFYKTEGQQIFKKQGNTFVGAPTQYIRKRLASTMLVDRGHNTSLATYIATKFPAKIMADEKMFFERLFQESPAIYQLFRRLSKRTGKALVYSITRSAFGAEIFDLIARKYIEAHPQNNLILPIPPQEKNIREYIDKHILHDKDVYLDHPEGSTLRKKHDENKRTFEQSKETGLHSPIYFFASKLSTGFSVSGGTRELHILTPASTQVEGRGHRMLAHCGAEWTYDVYQYMNIGLFPSFVSTCDLLYYNLVDKSNVGKLVQYAEDLIRASSFTCSALKQLNSSSQECGKCPALDKNILL
jgi:hypothetical protein